MTKKEEDKKKENDLEFVDYIHDPIHGNIDITQIEREIIHTPEFLKLRGIKQLGLKSLVFPGALHTRFEHSIGTMDVCDEYLDYLWDNLKDYLGIDYDPKIRQIMRLCGLLHDIGHGPFSHAIEEILETRKEWRPTIEEIKEVFFNKKIPKEFEESLDSESNKIFKDLDFKAHDAFSIFITITMPFKYEKFKENKSLFKEVAKILQGSRLSNKEKWKHDIIHGDIGADRVDYLLRDSHHTGSSFGIVDIEQILRYLELIDNSLHLGNKTKEIDISYKEKISRTVGENILISRIHHYNMLVENPNAVGIEKTLYRCLYSYLSNKCKRENIKGKISEIFLEWDDNDLIQEMKMYKTRNKFIEKHFPVLKGEKELSVWYRYDIHSFDPNLRFWLIVLEKNHRDKIERQLENKLEQECNIKDAIVDLSYLSSIPKLRMDSIAGPRFFYDESHISQGAIRDQMRNLSLTVFSLEKMKEEYRPMDLKDRINQVVSDCRGKALRYNDKFVYRHLKLLDFLSKNPSIHGIVSFYEKIKNKKEFKEYYKFKKVGHPTKFDYSHELYSDLMRLNAIDIIEVRSKDTPCSYGSMLDRSLSKIDKKEKNEIFFHSFKYNSIWFGIPKWARWTISYDIDVNRPRIKEILSQTKGYI